MGARTYKDLDVWKIADELRTAIRLMVRRPSFDRHEWPRLQLRRAANSGCTNAAEGCGRYLPRDFARFLRIARGSMNEIAEHMPDVRKQARAPPEDAEKKTGQEAARTWNLNVEPGTEPGTGNAEPGTGDR